MIDKCSGAGGAGDFEDCCAFATSCLMNGVGLHLEAVQASRFEMCLCRSLERHAPISRISQAQLSEPLVRSKFDHFRGRSGSLKCQVRW